MLAGTLAAVITAPDSLVGERTVVLHIPIQWTAGACGIIVAQRELDPLLVDLAGQHRIVLLQVSVAVQVLGIDHAEYHERTDTAAAGFYIPLQSLGHVVDLEGDVRVGPVTVFGCFPDVERKCLVQLTLPCHILVVVADIHRVLQPDLQQDKETTVSRQFIFFCL